MTLRNQIAAAITDTVDVEVTDYGYGDYRARIGNLDSVTDAAIAAFSEALLSDESVEAGADAVCGPERLEEWGYKIVREAHMDAYRKQLTAALAAITEGGQGDE